VTSRTITLAAIAVYAAAVVTAWIVKQHRDTLDWAQQWTKEIYARRDLLRAQWLASEGIVEEIIDA
jgi:hypothetical protein